MEVGFEESQDLLVSIEGLEDFPPKQLLLDLQFVGDIFSLAEDRDAG
jgi:hypothetical protein